MKKYKNTLFYVAVITFFTALIYLTAKHGVTLEIGRNVQHAKSDNSQWVDFINSMIYNLKHPLAILLAQIVTIVLAARLFGWISNKIGQPAVIGEMIAGIVLGPSLLGMYFPELSSTLFPKESLGNIQFLSQIGLIFFMYTIGMELDLKILKNKAHEAVVISHASIILPFALGMGLAYFIYQEFAPTTAPFLSFGLFIGIAMSITAFPVLARIVQERGIHKTKLGTIVITCAAADDITAWCILAVVIAIVKAGDFGSALFVIGLAVVYVLFMIKIVRPFLHRIATIYPNKTALTRPIIAIFFLVLILSAYATEVIGIHALFGAFMAGAIMPENMKFRAIFIEKVEDVAIVVLLPLFFVYTGLRTEIGLLNDPYLWKITGLIILVAVIGKFIGSALAAKFVGQNWRESVVIGALMNTRGLMELIVLNIGYDLGVLDAEIFAMMVIMALVTTFMTGPVLDLIDKIFKHKKDDEILQINNQPKYKILLNFSMPEKGKALLKIAHAFIKKDNESSLITGMHVLKSSDIEHHALEDREDQFFIPLIEEAENLNQDITTMFKVSTDTIQETLDVTQKGDYDLILIDIGSSIYSGSLLGNILGFTTKIINPNILIEQVTGRENMFDHSIFDERTKQLLNKSNIPVGIVLEKEIKKVDKIFLPLFGNHDADLLKYAQRLISNSEAQIMIVDVVGYTKKHSEVKEIIRSIENIAPNHISLLYKQSLDKEFLDEMDLMLISIESWKNLIETKSIWISNVPTTLIISE